MLDKKFNFETVQVGDYVKFKVNTENLNNQNKYSVYHCVVTDVSKETHLGVQIDQKDKRMDFPLGMTIYIDRRAVLQIYHKKDVENLTPRLALRKLWKNLIFREVKTTKCHELMHVDYKYIAQTGFENTLRFNTLEEAYENVEEKYHKNVIPIYNNFFGFTTSKIVRDNDKYHDTEIFFSKKCYCEFDFEDRNPTGDFSIEKRGDLEASPKTDQLICGIVEKGEKGLFFRKWFMCSREFLNLWTMVIRNVSVEEVNSIGSFLDTSKYSIDYSLSIEERIEKFQVYNLETCALYYNNRYKQIGELLFLKNENYSTFQKKFLKNIMWVKKLLV